MNPALNEVHPADACTASVAEMMRGNLPGEGNENVFDEVTTSSVSQGQIGVTELLNRIEKDEREDQSLSIINTTVNSPDTLAEDVKKYTAPSPGCDCETCRIKLMNQQQPAPIMITPYRHNWMISGNHKNQKDEDSWCSFQ